MVGPERPGVFGERGDHVLDDLIRVGGVRLLVGDVEPVAADQPDPQHDPRHDHSP
jgi:hypothetical protein